MPVTFASKWPRLPDKQIALASVKKMKKEVASTIGFVYKGL
jgi:hypothetical protein